jgi:UDP-glucose 4-epimerase
MPCLAITGANGFIGRHLTKAALARGWSVRALSRNTHWLRSLTPNDDLTIHPCDLTISQDPQILAGVDIVCHLAAYVPPNHDDPSYAEECLLNNALGTQRLLEAARQAGGIRFIYYSGGNSYAQQNRMVHESDLLFPSCHAVYYLASKLVGEMYCEHYRLGHNQQTATLRLSSVYGPGQITGVIPKFIQRLGDGCPIQIQDGGRYTVDLVFVEDVIQATWQVIEHSATGIYNIGSGQSHSILEVAQIIAEFTCASPDLLQVQPHTLAIRSGFSGLDVTKAQTTLGYEPTALRAGLKRCVESVKSHEREKVRSTIACS